ILFIGLKLYYHPHVEAKDTQPFRSDRFGLTLDYPAEWLVSENLGLLDFINPAHVSDTIEGPMMATVSIKMYDNRDRLSLDEAARRLFQQTVSSSTIEEPLHIGSLHVTNPAIDQAVVIRGIPSASSDYFTLISVNDKLYLLSLNLGDIAEVAGQQNAYNRTLFEMIESMSFHPASWEGYPLEEPVSIAASRIAHEFVYPLGNPDKTSWRVLQAFDNFFDNPRYNSYHAAEDWSNPSGATAGEPVYAVAEGVVRYANFANYPGDVVIIEHLLPDGKVWFSMYGHMGNHDVNQGDVVTRGQRIGTIYYWPDNSHLHFEIRHFYMEDEINGENSALSRHRNYPPGPGYWPVGTFRDTEERPPDRGWIEPRSFIVDHKRPEPITTTAMVGQVRLQGLNNYSGTLVMLHDQPCDTLDDIVLTTNLITSTGVISNGAGFFELLPPSDMTVNCVRVLKKNFLYGQIDTPANGDLGTITLLNGDLNGDNVINIFDLALISTYYKTDETAYDLNNDGLVNLLDVVLVASNYQQEGPIQIWE
ncbi:peptidoglycan DD-metalloendopeptidase family protein, partial [Anaerolineales bacterium HSG25]|nr:peptidoglycan DD-metalloendopeptidase family protein [Anaerolineales bacterium HSG25]